MDKKLVYLPLDKKFHKEYIQNCQKPNGSRVCTLIYDDEEEGSDVKLKSDPLLPVPEEDPVDPETLSKFVKYRIVESSLTVAQKRQLLELLVKNEDMFSKSAFDIGLCNKGEHHIDTGDAAPIHCRPHKMSHHLRPALKEELEELLKIDIIEPSLSDWAAPIIMVKKKDGGLRLCVDFRKLNQVARGCAYPLPRVHDTFSLLRGTRYYSTIDMKKGFWQIPLDRESREKTSFTTVFGQYQFVRMPFGLATAPSAFQSIMNLILRGLNWVHLMCYMDDILIFSSSFDQHLDLLCQVFTRLRDANMKASLSKCEWCRTQLTYLGHIITKEGIKVDPSKVEAVSNLPEPKSVLDVESFLGKVNYYSKFIPEFSKIGKPLFDLKLKRAKWDFGPDQLNAFNELKRKLCEAPVLKHPDFERPFIVNTDASGYGIGAVLSQNFEDGEHPIAYASRTLKDTECRYPVIEREALGIFWAVNHFKEFLDGAEFVVVTDHKPLVKLMNKDFDNPKLLEYATKLQKRQFKINYREGKYNQNADTLSRYPIIPCKGRRSKTVQTTESQSNSFDPNAVPEEPKKAVRKRKAKMVDNECQTEFVELVPGPAVAMVSAEPQDNEPRQLNDLVPLQRQHDFFGAVIEYLNDGTLPQTEAFVKEILLTAELYSLGQNGELYRLHQGRLLLCVPTELVQTILKESHELPSAGHAGIGKTHFRTIQRYWWRTMARDIREFVNGCMICIAYKSPPRNVRQPLGTRPTPKRVWERLHCDVWSPGGESTGGHVAVVAFVDMFSKYIILKAVKDHRAETIATVFIDEVAGPHGLPGELISDGAPEFRSVLAAEVFRLFGVPHQIVTPYRPQANGAIERCFRTIRPMLACIAREHPRSWHELLSMAAHAYNTSFHRSIKDTPFHLMYGRDAVPFVHADLEDADVTAGDIQDRLAEMERTRQIVAGRLAEEQAASKEQYDSNLNRLQIRSGDIVMLRCHQPPRNAVQKLAPKYVGPYRVTSIQHHVLEVVPLADPNVVPKRIHSDHARLCRENRMVELPEEDLLLPFEDAASIDPNLEAEDQ
jgi:hypothetical protein